MWLIRRGVSTEEGSKKGVGKMCKKFILFILFFAVMLHKVKKCYVTKNANYIFEELSTYI